jgi:hypothetical protein
VDRLAAFGQAVERAAGIGPCGLVVGALALGLLSQRLYAVCLTLDLSGLDFGGGAVAVVDFGGDGETGLL